MEIFIQNLVEVFQDPLKLIGMVAGGISVRLLWALKGFIKKKGVGYIVKVAFHYAIDLVTKNSDSLTTEQAEDKKKLVDGLLKTPEIERFMQKLDARALDEIDHVKSRINDVNAKLTLDYIKENKELYNTYLEERKRLSDKLAMLNEKIS